MKYDYLVVGAGPFGATFAHLAHKVGKKVLVVEKRPHVGGNLFTKDIEGIPVHCYGPHLFHTNSKRLWEFVNRFAEFNSYQHQVKATYKEKVFTLPFCLATFKELWGCQTPNEAKQKLSKEIEHIDNPQNVEQWALAHVGRDIYDKLIYGYTKKQWGREPRQLPASIIKRLPLRFDWNSNYFNDRFQGVPIQGYTHLIENMLDGVDVKLNEEFNPKSHWQDTARKLVYTGPIDAFFDYKHGHLAYRTLDFKVKTEQTEDCQGCGQMNFTEEAIPWTRIVEPKHFHGSRSMITALIYEYPKEWEPGDPPYYPVNDEGNNEQYRMYKEEIVNMRRVIAGGRLAEYKYYNMDQVFASAIHRANIEFKA